MSAKRHHYIPKMILKRFASQQSGTGKKKKSFIYQFSKSAPTFESNIDKVAVGKYFYDTDDESVEDDLARFESKIDDAFYKISQGADPNFYRSDISLFCWVQAIRTRALRERFAELGGMLFSKIEKFSETNEFRRYVENHIERYLDSHIDEILEEDADLSHEQKIMMKNMLYNNIGREQLLSVFKQSMPALPKLTSQLRQHAEASGGVGRAAKQGAVRGIKQLLSDGNPPDSVAKKVWKIVNIRDFDLFLSDTVVMGADYEGKIFPLISSPSSAEHIIMPVSENSLLVGSDPGHQTPTFDSEFRKDLLGCSREHIFGSSLDLISQEDVSLIGSNAHILSEEEMDTIVFESLYQEKQ